MCSQLRMLTLPHQCQTAAYRCWWPPRIGPASEQCDPVSAARQTRSPLRTESVALPASPLSLSGCYIWLCTISRLHQQREHKLLALMFIYIRGQLIKVFSMSCLFYHFAISHQYSHLMMTQEKKILKNNTFKNTTFILFSSKNI